VSSARSWPLALFGVLLLAAALRFAWLDRLPPGLTYDEAAYGLQALELRASPRLELFFPAFTGREPLFLYVLALSTGLLGQSVLALRATSAAIGVGAVLATALAFPASLDRVGARQTNVDLIAQYVHTAAQPGDLILVNPWYVGITFNRYYRGPVRWMTLPPMEDLTVHRYDLLKLRMTSAEPLAPLYGAIQGALESRHRVWLVGGLLFPPAGYVPPVLPPAPGLPTGWSDGPYTIGWALQTGHFVQTHAERLAVVKIPVDRPVNGLENMGLLVVEGWRRPELQNGDSKTPALPYSPR